jgi:hypothetical protein
MLRADRTATPPSTATAVVTVDPVGDAHRALFPALPVGATHIIAARRDSALIAVELFSDTAGIPALRMRAQQYAAHWGYAYFEPCGWCDINCTPTDRLDHERLSRGNETTWRAAA